MLPIDAEFFSEDGKSATDNGKGKHNEPDLLQGSCITPDQSLAGKVEWHSFDDFDESGGILGIFSSNGFEFWELGKLVFKEVLESHTANSDTESLSESPEEGEHGNSVAGVTSWSSGLDGEGHGWEQHTGSETGNQVDEDPADGWSVDVEEIEETLRYR